MHALRHVHELLVPRGTLVVMHPVTEERVESCDGVVGVIREPDWVEGDLPNAEAGLEQTVRDGFYELEVETEYDVLQHFDTVEELIDAKRDLLEEQRELTSAIRAAMPPVVTRMRVVFRRLRAIAASTR